VWIAGQYCCQVLAPAAVTAIVLALWMVVKIPDTINGSIDGNIGQEAVVKVFLPSGSDGGSGTGSSCAGIGRACSDQGLGPFGTADGTSGGTDASSSAADIFHQVQQWRYFMMTIIVRALVAAVMEVFSHNG